MDKQESLEKELRELILDIQNCDPVTEKSHRRRKMNRFFRLLDRNFSIYKPKRTQIHPSLAGAYEEICGEARSLLWELLNEMMKTEDKKYNPDRAPAIAWIRFYMNRRCLPQAVKNIMGRNRDWGTDVESVLHQETEPPEPLSEKVRMVLQLDPSGEFKCTYVQGNPQANFQVLALRVYEKKSWDDLANELNEKVPTLSGFFQKWLKRRFAAYIRSYIQENF